MAEYDYAVFAGNIGAIYEKRTVGKDNISVVDFTVGTTRRRRNKQGEWEDAPTRWRRVTAWNRLADNLVESFSKGDRIMVFGRVEMQDPYKTKDKDGNEVEREAREQITAEDLGHSIQRWSAKTERDPSKNSGNGGGNSGGNSNNSGGGRKAQQSEPAQSKSQEDDILDGELLF